MELFDILMYLFGIFVLYNIHFNVEMFSTEIILVFIKWLITIVMLIAISLEIFTYLKKE